MIESFTIAGVTASPGEKANGAVAVNGLFADGQPLELPFIIFNGGYDGPRLYIQLAQHPAETWGLEGVYNVFSSLDPEELSGVVTFSLPNPVGFRFATYFPPQITHDINRVGAGDPKGSLMERIVHSWWTNFVEEKADYVIDIHGVPPETFVYYEAEGVSPGVPVEVTEKSERMALLYGSRSVQKQVEAYGGGSSFRGACVDNGIPAIVPEVSMDGAAITERGIRNIMIDLGMIEGEIALPPVQYILKWVADRKTAAVACDVGGCFIPKVGVGDVVKRGDEVGFMYSPRTFEVLETLTAHRDGYVSSIRNYPVKSAGESLMSILEILEVVKNG
jgi:predicted deacylase